jgi:hypothetical protein
MTDNDKSVTDAMDPAHADNAPDGPETQSRRDFLIGLGKWSRAVIVGAIVGGTAVGNKPAQAGVGWLNRRGGGAGWVNGRGGYGGSWANRRGGFGGSWVNHR